MYLQGAITGGGVLGLAFAVAAQAGDPVPAPTKLPLGRLATPAELAAWDTDIRPDGAGLPDGQGDVMTGEAIYTERCAACHGDFGEAVGRFPPVAGGEGSLRDARPVKSIGSYWPYLSTVFDYVARTMPYAEPGSLSADETYAVTAYLLYLNDLVDDDFVLSRDTFAGISLPNAGGFRDDDRAATEHARFAAPACMQDCRPAVKITVRATDRGVTPADTAAATAAAIAADAARKQQRGEQ